MEFDAKKNILTIARITQWYEFR